MVEGVGKALVEAVERRTLAVGEGSVGEQRSVERRRGRRVSKMDEFFHGIGVLAEPTVQIPIKPL